MITRKQVEDEALAALDQGARHRVADIPDRTSVYITAHIPEYLVKPLLQHVRDFDKAHNTCHLEVCIDGPSDSSMAEMIRALIVEPELTFAQIFARAEASPVDLPAPLAPDGDVREGGSPSVATFPTDVSR